MIPLAPSDLGPCPRLPKRRPKSLSLAVHDGSHNGPKPSCRLLISVAKYCSLWAQAPHGHHRPPAAMVRTSQKIPPPQLMRLSHISCKNSLHPVLIEKLPSPVDALRLGQVCMGSSPTFFGPAESDHFASCSSVPGQIMKLLRGYVIQMIQIADFGVCMNTPNLSEKQSTALRRPGPQLRCSMPQT